VDPRIVPSGGGPKSEPHRHACPRGRPRSDDRVGLFPTTRGSSTHYMLAAIAAQLARRTGDAARPAASPAHPDSLAFRYASVLRTIEALSGTRLRGVQIVGGGSRNAYISTR
jgi:sugar (pentulose or hexulose) kinase